jgi:hypothetical protein
MLADLLEEKSALQAEQVVTPFLDTTFCINSLNVLHPAREPRVCKRPFLEYLLDLCIHNLDSVVLAVFLSDGFRFCSTSSQHWKLSLARKCQHKGRCVVPVARVLQDLLECIPDHIRIGIVYSIVDTVADVVNQGTSVRFILAYS